jgi:hypothetical protein
MTVAVRKGISKLHSFTDSPPEDEYGDFAQTSPPNQDPETAVEGTVTRIFYLHIIIVLLSSCGH